MKIKKTLCLVLAMAMMLMLAACGDSDGKEKASDLKIGCIMLGDETEGYTAAHINGIKAAAEELGLSDNLVWKYKVDESSSCYDAAVDLVGQGCNIIFSNSYGHQTYMVQAAQEYPDVTFVAMTGDFAAICGLCWTTELSAIP